MEDNTVQFTMRMDKEVYEKLKESAKKNKRSIAKELEYITETFLTSSFPVILPKDIAKKFIDFLFGSNSNNVKEEEYKLYKELLQDDLPDPFKDPLPKREDTDKSA